MAVMLENPSDAGDGMGAADLLLELDDPVDERLGGRGQPGTYTSTGTMRSQPRTTE